MVIGVMSASMLACGNGETKEKIVDNKVQEESVESEVTEATQTVPEEDSDEDVTIEVVEGTAHSAEYNERFELGERTGATYMKAGDSEVTEFSDWKEGYSTLVEDIEADGTGTGGPGRSNTGPQMRLPRSANVFPVPDSVQAPDL